MARLEATCLSRDAAPFQELLRKKGVFKEFYEGEGKFLCISSHDPILSKISGRNRAFSKSVGVGKARDVL